MRWISSKHGALGLGVGALTVAAATVGLTVAAGRTTGVAAAGQAPAATALQSIGPLAFSPDGVLFAADRQAAAIYAFELGTQGTGGAPGATDVAGIDQQIASLVGTDGRKSRSPTSRCTRKRKTRTSRRCAGRALRRSRCWSASTAPASSQSCRSTALKMTKATLTNAPNQAAPGQQRNPRMESITDMAFVEGKLIVAGLSNEEFASKLRTIAYPFAAVENGTSVEIYHGNHGAFETRSPVISFVPYKVANTPHLIAGYTCTPLVKFPVSSLAPGAKVMGTTIAELGNRNRPTDMIVYNKGGKDYLLIANTSRGVMKVATDGFATAPGITARVASETGGVGFEPVAALKGVEQLDRLDEQRAIVLTRAEGAPCRFRRSRSRSHEVHRSERESACARRPSFAPVLSWPARCWRPVRRRPSQPRLASSSTRPSTPLTSPACRRRCSRLSRLETRHPTPGRRSCASR